MALPGHRFVTGPRYKLHRNPLRAAVSVLTDVGIYEVKHPDNDRQRQNGGQHCREAAKEETPEIL